MTLLAKFEHNQLFTDREGWWLFRLAAIGEAVGWTLLISGLAAQRYLFHDNPAPVTVAGQIHGMLFFGYATAAVGLYPTLRWSRPQALVALLASVPPYGSLVFEQWAAHQRRHRELVTYSRVMRFHLMLAQQTAT